MITGFLNLPWFLWTGLALLVAVIYSFVWPRKAVTTTTGFRYFVLRWDHTLTWILLAVSFVLCGVDPSLNGAVNLVAAGGGLVYLLFLVMTFIIR